MKRFWQYDAIELWFETGKWTVFESGKEIQPSKEQQEEIQKRLNWFSSNEERLQEGEIYDL